MEREKISTLTDTFEANAQQTETGVEYWLARDLQHLLGYDEWRNFNAAISKAKSACEVSGHAIRDHFVDVNKTIQMPKGAVKEVRDLMLTRYAKRDHALFSKTTQAMKAQWKVPDNRPLADFAPTIILKAKDFAAEITIFNAQARELEKTIAANVAEILEG